MTIPVQIALRFANDLVQGDFDAAHFLLTPSMRKQWPDGKLQEAYETMVEYLEPAPDDTEVITQLHEWPDRKPGETRWVQVAISAEEGSEAVAVVIDESGDEPLISSIQWGRP